MSGMVKDMYFCSTRAGDRKTKVHNMTKRRLSIGIQTFREMREENCYYVDKTTHMWRLISAAVTLMSRRPCTKSSESERGNL